MGLDVLLIIMGAIIMLTGCFWILSFRNKKLEKIATASNVALFGFSVLSYILFLSLFITHQYSFNVVYQNSNHQMPFLLLISSSWAGQSGSFFLWSCMHSIMFLIVLKYKHHKSIVSLVLLFNQAVLLFLLYRSQPFQRTPILFQNGIGLNPVLSHIYMAIHPPLAFFGYSLISLLFSFAFSHLLKPVNHDWLVHLKKWVYFAFFSISSAIVLGSLWAYSILGWGGLWAFDPIENASLVTWILLLLLIHHISWYQKKKIRPWASTLLIILTFASVYHMTMLLRSGLIENLTQHAYIGDKLLMVLFIVDLFYFVIPIVFYVFRFKSIETDSDKEYFTSTPYVKVFFSLLLGGLVCLLLININQPLINNLMITTLPSSFSPFLPIFHAGVISLLVLLQIPQLVLLFRRNRHKIQHISMNIMTILFALLLTFLFVILSGNTVYLFSVSIVFIFLASLWIVESIQVEKKDRLKDLIDRISHVSLGLLIIGYTLTSTPATSQSIFLLPKDTVTSGTNQFKAQDLIEKKEMYIGYLETYPIEITMEGKTYQTNPAIWTYERKSLNHQLHIPFIQQNGFYDLQIIPKSNNRIEFNAEEAVLFKNTEIVVNNRIYSKKTGGMDLIPVTADLIIKRYNKTSDNIEPYETEVIHLKTVMNNEDIKYEADPPYSAFLGSEIMWSLSETNHVVIRSPYWNNAVQIDIIKKPFVICVRIAYLLLIICIFIRLIFFRLKTWGSMYLFPSYQHEQRRRRHRD